MQTHHKKDAAFTSLLNNMLQTSGEYLEIDTAPMSDQHEQLLALQRRFSAPPVTPFQPGKFVQWKAGMQNRKFPRAGEPAIVMEVFSAPLFSQNPDNEGSNVFREPLSLVLGILDEDGDFLLFHYDGRRFEVMADEGCLS